MSVGFRSLALRVFSCTFIGLSFSVIFAMHLAAEDAFRPPAVPLVACDPYFSVWSQGDDRLWETETTHWTGKPHRLSAFVREGGVVEWWRYGCIEGYPRWVCLDQFRGFGT